MAKQSRIWNQSLDVSPNITLALTGVSSAVSVGTLGVTLAIAVSGIVSTVSAGSVVANRTKTLTGISSTVSPGSLVATRSAAITGTQVTLSSGLVVATRSVPVTGNVTTLSPGVLSPTRRLPLSGIAITLSPGTVVYSQSGIVSSPVVVSGDRNCERVFVDDAGVLRSVRVPSSYFERKVSRVESKKSVSSPVSRTVVQKVVAPVVYTLDQLLETLRPGYRTLVRKKILAQWVVDIAKEISDHPVSGFGICISQSSTIASSGSLGDIDETKTPEYRRIVLENEKRRKQTEEETVLWLLFFFS